MKDAAPPSVPLPEKQVTSWPRPAEVAGPGGPLLVLDDLQWADEASAVLLADVVRQLRGAPILIVATYRDSRTTADTSAGLLARLSADANTVRVDLRGLPARRPAA